MKITENKIKQIILEELSDILEQDDQNKEQETKPAPGQNPEEKEKDMSGELLTKVKRNNKIVVEFKGTSTISRTD